MSIYEKYGLTPFGATPSAKQLEWHSRERMVFFHFGMNTFTGKEWGDGGESPSLFNPDRLDTRQWIKTIKDGGAKCAILTAKHHDGFCLWPTKYTEHSIKSSPYKNGNGDIVREFVDACEEFGIKAGIYLSPWDRHEPSWGSEAYNDFYVGQLTELLTNYGKIWEIWWDGAGSTEAVYDWEKWAKCVHTLQPDAVIFGSLGATPWVDVRWVGNERGVAGKPCYSTIDPSSLIQEITSELNSGKIGGSRFIPAEVDVSIRPGWFYHEEQDTQVRSVENLIELWFSSNGSNAGFLLNLPPDRHGLIHENDARALIEFNNVLSKALSRNLAIDAKIRSSSHRIGCEAINLLCEDTSLFYAPSCEDVCPELFLEFDEEIEFNAFMLSEAIELGHKVTGYEVSAYVDGAWRLLSSGKCIGYKLCEKFDAIKSRLVKIKLTSVLDTPVLTFLGLYFFDTGVAKIKLGERKNLIASNSAEVKITRREIDVNLGGIFSFNEIKLYNLSKCSYELLIFNGSAFEPYLKGEGEGDITINLEKSIDYSYRFKLVMNNDINEKTKIEVY